MLGKDFCKGYCLKNIAFVTNLSDYALPIFILTCWAYVSKNILQALCRWSYNASNGENTGSEYIAVPYLERKRMSLKKRPVFQHKHIDDDFRRNSE